MTKFRYILFLTLKLINIEVMKYLNYKLIVVGLLATYIMNSACYSNKSASEDFIGTYIAVSDCLLGDYTMEIKRVSFSSEVKIMNLDNKFDNVKASISNNLISIPLQKKSDGSREYDVEGTGVLNNVTLVLDYSYDEGPYRTFGAVTFCETLAIK